MKNVVAYTKVIMAIFLWASTIIAGRILSNDMSPLGIAWLRFALSALILLPLLFYKNKGRLPRLSSSMWVRLIGISFVGVFLHSYFLLHGISLLSASQTAVILATTPIFVTIGAHLFANEQCTLAQWFGILVSLLGAAIVVTDGHLRTAMLDLDMQHIKGLLYLVGTMVVWTAFILLSSDYPAKLGNSTFFTYLFVIAAFFFSLAMPMTAGPHIQRITLPGALSVIMFVLSTVLPYSWYIDASNTLGASRASVFTNLMPIFSVTEAMGILNERPSVPFFIGSAIILAGIIFVNHKKTDKPAISDNPAV